MSIFLTQKTEHIVHLGWDYFHLCSNLFLHKYFNTIQNIQTNQFKCIIKCCRWVLLPICASQSVGKHSILERKTLGCWVRRSFWYLYTVSCVFYLSAISIFKSIEFVKTILFAQIICSHSIKDDKKHLRDFLLVSLSSSLYLL